MSNDDLFFAWDNDPVVVPAAIEPKAPCALCAECSLYTAPFVPSYKPSIAPQLAIVGEAPGLYEQRALEPFVGPSGQLLDAVLEHIGIDTQQCFKTNAVLCRPKNNDMTRHADAIRCCAPRLQAELAALDCAKIVALGATAVKALDSIADHSDTLGILKRRGNWYDLDFYDYTNDREDGEYQYTMQYLATLHPAFVLRSTGYISQFLNDMRSITLDRQQRDWLKTPYHVLPTIDFTNWVNAAIHAHAKLSFDVETANLDTNSELLALGLAISKEYAIIISGSDVHEPAIREELIRLFSGTRPIAHNAKFDLQVLENNGIERFKIYDDTMLAHGALDEMKGTHGLKNLLTAFLGVPDYEAMLVDKYFRGTDREKRDYSKIPLGDLYQYLAIDCVGTLELQELLEPMIAADGVENAHKLLLLKSEALTAVEAKGIMIDRPYLEIVLTKLTDAITLAEKEVKKVAAQYVAEFLEQNQPLGFFGNKTPAAWIKTIDQYRKVLYKCLDINLASWQQMQVLLYDVLELKHVKRLSYKTDPRSTNQEALDALEGHIVVDKLREFRRLDKMRGTYVEKLLALADDNDRVHVRFNVLGTETYRLSADDSLHGIPRPSDIWGQAIRGSFIAPAGKKLLVADYAQAELRCFAAESKEPFLLEIFNNGEDPHGIVTLQVYGDDPRFAGMTRESFDKQTRTWQLPNITGFSSKDQKNYWKEVRTTGKNVVFGGLVYLGKANGIVGMIRAQTGKIIDQQIVDKVLKAMLAQMPTAREWQQNQFRQARDQGFVQSRFDYKRRFMLITDDNLDEVRKASVNAPIQNAAAELTSLSAVELINLDYDVLHIVHDSIILEVDDDPQAIATAEQQVRATMVGMGMRCFPEVAWEVDIDIGDRWYEDRPSFEEDRHDNT